MTTASAVAERGAADHAGGGWLDESARTLNIFNISGDSTLTWSPANDDVMRDVIAQKLKQGFNFYIVKPRAGGILPARRVRVTDVRKAMEARSLSMDDEDFARLVSEGAAHLVKTPRTEPLRDGDAHVSRNAAEIASSQRVIAHRPPVGG